MQKTAVERIKFYPPVEDEYGYTQTVRVGHTLHLSGMIGHDAGVMHPDPERQYQLVYQNIAEILASNGACLADVIRETVFYTAEMAGIDPAARRAFRGAAYGEAFPASTWVQVAGLLTPGAFIEIEVTAVLPV